MLDSARVTVPCSVMICTSVLSWGQTQGTPRAGPAPRRGTAEDGVLIGTDGATGTAQLAEVAWQLRGRAGARQVARHGVGLVETMGGGAAGMDGNACVVTILSTQQ